MEAEGFETYENGIVPLSDGELSVQLRKDKKPPKRIKRPAKKPLKRARPAKPIPASNDLDKDAIEVPDWARPK